MNSRVCRWLCAVVAAALVAGCKEDPTASQAGQPALLLVNPQVLFLNVGDSTDITAVAYDQNQRALPGSASAVSTAPATASVRPATDVLPDPTHTTNVFVVVGTAAGAAYIRVTSNGLTDSTQVTVQ